MHGTKSLKFASKEFLASISRGRGLPISQILRQQTPPKCWQLFTNENSVISQKTRVFINNSIRTSNLTISYGALRNSKKGTNLKPLH
jgi:predicted GTPase